MSTHADPNENQSPLPGHSETRRDFLSTASLVTMIGGLGAGYGTFFSMAGRLLYPVGPTDIGWLFVSDLAGFPVGKAIEYQAPSGQPITIARVAENGTEADFIALSSVCPHLGCRVHWEAQNDRFFCPCHNGAFDSKGTATAGPPLDAKQSLSRFPLKVENGLLFIEVAMTPLVAADPARIAPTDPCRHELRNDDVEAIA